MSDVLTWANRSRAKEVVILLDCCHSGALGQITATDNAAANIREGVSILTAGNQRVGGGWRQRSVHVACLRCARWRRRRCHRQRDRGQRLRLCG